MDTAQKDTTDQIKVAEKYAKKFSDETVGEVEPKIIGRLILKVQ